MFILMSTEYNALKKIFFFLKKFKKEQLKLNKIPEIFPLNLGPSQAYMMKLFPK